MRLKEELREALDEVEKAVSQVCWESVVGPLRKLMVLMNRALEEGIEDPSGGKVNRSSKKRPLENKRHNRA